MRFNFTFIIVTLVHISIIKQ